MKATNNIVEKYGIDKILHFLIGLFLIALASIVGIVFFGFTGFLVASFLMLPIIYSISYYKEKKLDDHYDILDIKAAMLGSGIMVIINVTLFAINAIIKDL